MKEETRRRIRIGAAVEAGLRGRELAEMAKEDPKWSMQAEDAAKQAEKTKTRVAGTVIDTMVAGPSRANPGKITRSPPPKKAATSKLNPRPNTDAEAARRAREGDLKDLDT
ncbi:hypothetical protein FKW77_000548 [Venturia effusa]|uniref:Uncharacterized protein n=1 Tax=Venturia effusa TaxID=50376 RepID=A0A517LRD0_9PEZI|nr:hypothetical protein FKW77_000548 [Venturia effusa]